MRIKGIVAVLPQWWEPAERMDYKYYEYTINIHMYLTEDLYVTQF